MYDDDDYPICEECGERIYDDDFFDIGGNYYHKKCVYVIRLETWLANHGKEEY